MSTADFEKELKALQDQIALEKQELTKKQNLNQTARVVLQKKSSELKAPDLLTKDKTGFNDELSALNNEIKKMKEEFQPILKPLKDWQDDIGRKLYESNTKLTQLKEQNAAVKSTEAPNTEEKRQIDNIAKQFREVNKMEIDKKRTDLYEEPQKK